MALEFAADEGEAVAYPLPVGDGTPAVVDWRPMLDALLSDLQARASVGVISGRFHNALAAMAVAAAERFDCQRVVISGGCFQNRVLSILVRKRLEQAGFEVFSHGRVPPGDGGIPLGQLYVATGSGMRTEVNEAGDTMGRQHGSF